MSKKHFKKQPQPHSQADPCSSVLKVFFKKINIFYFYFKLNFLYFYIVLLYLYQK